MFNKKLYWERRKKGLRGQEDTAPLQVSRVTGMKGALNRVRSRRKFVDRTTTKRGYVYGIQIGSPTYLRLQKAKRKFAKEHKGEHIPSEEQRIHLENHPLRIDPNKTNQQRFLERKEARNAKRNSATKTAAV